MAAKPRTTEVSRSNVSFKPSNSVNKFKEHCSMFLEEKQPRTSGKFRHMQNFQLGKDVRLIEKSNLPKIVDEIVTTPPNVVPKAAQIPGAPMKEKKHCVKLDLRPRKLVYVDEELELNDRLASIDSGFFSKCNSPLNDRNSAKGVAGNCRNVPSPKSSKSIAAAKPVDSSAEDGMQAFRRVTRNAAKLNAANKENLYEAGKEKTPRNEITKTKKKDNAKDLNVARKKDSKYKGFNPNCTILSQCDEELDWQSKLRWLQARRDVGLWVQCCRLTCQKWRYVEEYHDPVDVPEEWFCEMNSDKSIASCNIPEVPKSAELEEDLIENKYNAGSIVWAYVRGYPWWPAMIDDAPETLSFYKLPKSSTSPTKYHVIFFSEKVETAWLSPQNIKPFIRCKKEDLVKKTIYRGIDYKNELEEACKLAKTALKFSIRERLEKFSIVARCSDDATSSNLDKGDECDTNNNVPDICDHNDLTASDLFSLQNSFDDDEDYVQTSQQTIQTSISMSGYLRQSTSSFKESVVHFSKRDVLNSKHKRSMKKKVSWNIQELPDALLQDSLKDNINNINETHSIASSTSDCFTGDTVLPTHNTDPEENNVSNSESNILSTISKFWERTGQAKKNKLELSEPSALPKVPCKQMKIDCKEATLQHNTVGNEKKNKLELCDRNVSPTVPHKQIKIDCKGDLSQHNAVRSDTFDGHIPKDTPSVSSKPLSTMEQIRLRWQQNLKNYTESYRKTFPF